MPVHFFHGYNTMPHHRGLGWMTPLDVHDGAAGKRFQEREAVLQKAFETYPERFVRGVPTPPALPQEVWISKPRTKEDSTEELDIPC